MMLRLAGDPGAARRGVPARRARRERRRDDPPGQRARLGPGLLPGRRLGRLRPHRGRRRPAARRCRRARRRRPPTPSPASSGREPERDRPRTGGNEPAGPAGGTESSPSGRRASGRSSWCAIPASAIVTAGAAPGLPCGAGSAGRSEPEAVYRTVAAIAGRLGYPRRPTQTVYEYLGIAVRRGPDGAPGAAAGGPVRGGGHVRPHARFAARTPVGPGRGAAAPARRAPAVSALVRRRAGAARRCALEARRRCAHCVGRRRVLRAPLASRGLDPRAARGGRSGSRRAGPPGRCGCRGRRSPSGLGEASRSGPAAGRAGPGATTLNAPSWPTRTAHGPCVQVVEGPRGVPGAGCAGASRAASRGREAAAGRHDARSAARTRASTSAQRLAARARGRRPGRGASRRSRPA